MRYENFQKDVDYYKNILSKQKIKNIYVHGDINKNAFYSMAPFSRACSELGIEMGVSFKHNLKEESKIFRIWKTYVDLKNKNMTTEAKALKTLLDEIKVKELNKYFEPVDVVLEAKKKGFVGNLKLDYKINWFSDFMSLKLKKTTDTIIKNVFGLKKSERFGIGFELVPNKKFLSHPLQDYLDSYAISYNVFLSAKNKCKSISIGSSTRKESMRDNPEKTSELMTTILGLELEKDIDLPVFKKYNVFSKLLKLGDLKIPEAKFFISGKGYHGKHIFGEKIGYPTQNKKTKWNNPGGIVYKFHWYPQSVNEDRPPLSRIAFTSTVPIDKLVESTLIDYNLMRGRNAKIAKELEKCDKIIVKSNIKDGCDFEVGLIYGKKKRMILPSDSDARYVVNPRMLKETKKKYGMMANIPGGEAFTTPSYLVGKIVGDVVISIDRSYSLDSKNPLVAIADKKGYKIIKGPKKVVDAFNKRKKESWKNILEQEKNKSLSKEIIALKKKNFENIGEFAINTNPNAKLCDYLIINEKIANMIHVAFGSGFEPDMATEYHMDVVIDSPRQKLDICGVDNKGKQYWIIKQGKFVI